MFFDKVLKGSSTSVWIRNFHLAFFSVFLALAGVFSQPKEIEQVQTYGFFAGYSGVVWTLVAISGGGGLLVAAVVKYADNILKAFATSCSVVGVFVVSALFFGFPVSSLFVGGTALVIYAMFLYGDMLKNLPCCTDLPPFIGGGGGDSGIEAAAAAPPTTRNEISDPELNSLLEKG